MKASLEIMVLFLFYKLFIKKYFFILKTIIISEEQKHKLDLLLEDKATDTLKKYIRNTCADYLKPYLDTNINQLPQQLSDSLYSLDDVLFKECSDKDTNLMMFLRIHFLKNFDIRHGKGPIKFIIGLARIGLGELGFYSNTNNQSDLALLKQLVLFADNNEQVKQSLDENLNGMSFQELKSALNEKRKEFNRQMRTQLGDLQVTNGKYKVVPINSAKEAEQYGQYTSWCVTHGSYGSYAKNGSRFYFCLREGFENVPRQVGNGCPLDDYGLSMVSVLVDMDGEPTIVTTRWNHDNDGENNENLHTAKQVQEVLGIPFYQTFKPYTREELHTMGIILFDEVQELLDSGKQPSEVFDRLDLVNGFSEFGWMRVKLNDKHNFINQKNKLLSNQWYDFVCLFINGFAEVKLNNKYNFINQEGKYISSQWFDLVREFDNGFAPVQLNGKWNYINQEGKYISSQWFDFVGNFYNGFAQVELNNKVNFINQEGKYISSQWFDFVDNFKNGFAQVRLNGKCNFINNEYKLIGNQWFDWVGFFSEGFAKVELNDKWNFISRECKLLSNQWFDFVGNFYNGFAKVELNDKLNFINQEGKLLNNQWFDEVGSFYNGFATVRLNGKCNFINNEYKLISNQWFDFVGDFYNGVAMVKLNNKWYKINQKGEIVESRNRNKKTIIITEEQKKKLKKAIAAQNQVGGKVNAGVMDAVVGGMCEDATDDKYVIGGEMNAPIGGVYYHVANSKLNESPDSFYDGDVVNWSKTPSISFMLLNYDNKFYVGKECEPHGKTIRDLIANGKINDVEFEKQFENFRTLPYSTFFDVEMTGRYFVDYNIISFWKTPIESKSKIQKVVNLLSEQIKINVGSLLLDYWDESDNQDCIFPYKWLFNGTYNMFKDNYQKIVPAKTGEYIKTGTYSYFQVTTKDRRLLYVSLNGDEILMPMEYFMKPTVNESIGSNRMIDIQQIIKSDNFKKWFGDWQNNPQNSSKVVDESGIPLIVHHGSPKFEGDRFNKSFIGKSMNRGEEGIFCTTPDMDWAKRFSYPARQGSSSVSVKLDTTKQGDILSGFLNIRHPLDFFNLTEEDYNNMWQMVIESKKAQGFDNFDKQKWFDELHELLKIGNHQLIKFDLCGGWGNFGDILKQYGYDGYIAKMSPKDSAVEYCFIEPNQFKSIKSLGFNPDSESIYESNNKDIRIKEEKTDFGKVLYFNSNNNSFKFALYQYDDEPDVLYLANVSVNKSHRKNGLGNYILTFVDDFANKINASAILLKVKKDSFMFEWYKRNGYKYHSDADSSYVWMIKKMKDKTSVIEGKKKIIKNDKGEVVPEKCDKCGGKVVLQIHGEPVYVCKDCGKYFGTMPFSLKEGKLNESFEAIYDIYDDYQIYDLLSEFEKDKRNGITVKQWNLIPAQQYHTLLKRYMASPEMARIPYNVVYNWFMTVVKNAVSIEYITQLAGHTQFFPVDDVMDYFGEEINDYDDGSEYLESIGFYDWCKLPDGTDAWSDYGLKPLFEIIDEYKPNSSAEEILILINRCLDVVHWRGDLSSAFIQGGKKSCDYISNLKESIDYSKWLKQLKKRRDPGNIEENVENETKWNGQGQEWHNLIKPNEIPQTLYHCSDRKNRTSILKNGIIASVGEQYKEWWNYEGPKGELSDEQDLPKLVFLTDKPNTWSNNYYLDRMDIYQIDTNKIDSKLLFLDPTDIMARGGSYCYEGNIPRDAIKLIDTRQYSKSVNENVENELSSSEVDLSSFNIKKKLNPEFWVDGHLDSRIRMKLLDIADDFIETLGISKVKPVDVIMTGSLANFNWNKKFSDVDLHIVYDFNDIDENKEFIKQYFDLKKQIWNEKHKDLTIYGFNVELYVQDENEPHASSGVYSIDKDTWLVKPDRDTLTSSKVNKQYIKDKTSYYATKIDELCYYFKKAKDDEYKIRKIYEKSDKLFDEIKKLRKIGFEKSGGKEFNNYNIVFKWLRRYGYIEKLSNLKTKSYDKLSGI